MRTRVPGLALLTILLVGCGGGGSSDGGGSDGTGDDGSWAELPAALDGACENQVRAEACSVAAGSTELQGCVQPCARPSSPCPTLSCNGELVDGTPRCTSLEDPAALDCILDEVQGGGAHRYEILLETFEGMGVWGSEYDELIVSESGQFVRHEVRRKFAPPEFDEARLLWGVVDPTRAQACRGLTDPQEALDCVRDIFEGGCEKVEELDCMLAP